MNRTILFATLTGLLLGSAAVVPAFAQGTAQTLALTSIDPTTVATGYRATKVVGSDVMDEAGAKVGTVDDLIVTQADQVPFIIVSVGGFLGMGEKHIVVRASSISVVDNKIVLMGATKESLTALPSFTYAK